MATKPLVFELNDSDGYQPLLRLEQTCGMKSGKVHLLPGAECGEHSTGIVKTVFG